MIVTDANGNREATPEEIAILTETGNKFKSHIDSLAVDTNKQQAMFLLSQTDWALQPDVTTGTHKLTNQAEFLTYRDQIRAIVVNPTANVTWPTMPTAQWSS